MRTAQLDKLVDKRGAGAAVVVGTLLNAASMCQRPAGMRSLGGPSATPRASMVVELAAKIRRLWPLAIGEAKIPEEGTVEIAVAHALVGFDRVGSRDEDVTRFLVDLSGAEVVSSLVAGDVTGYAAALARSRGGDADEYAAALASYLPMIAEALSSDDLPRIQASVEHGALRWYATDVGLVRSLEVGDASAATAVSAAESSSGGGFVTALSIFGVSLAAGAAVAYVLSRNEGKEEIKPEVVRATDAPTRTRSPGSPSSSTKPASALPRTIPSSLPRTTQAQPKSSSPMRSTAKPQKVTPAASSSVPFGPPPLPASTSSTPTKADSDAWYAAEADRARASSAPQVVFANKMAEWTRCQQKVVSDYESQPSKPSWDWTDDGVKQRLLQTKCGPLPEFQNVSGVEADSTEASTDAILSSSGLSVADALQIAHRVGVLPLARFDGNGLVWTSRDVEFGELGEAEEDRPDVGGMSPAAFAAAVVVVTSLAGISFVQLRRLTRFLHAQGVDFCALNSCTDEDPVFVAKATKVLGSHGPQIVKALRSVGIGFRKATGTKSVLGGTPELGACAPSAQGGTFVSDADFIRWTPAAFSISDQEQTLAPLGSASDDGLDVGASTKAPSWNNTTYQSCLKKIPAKDTSAQRATATVACAKQASGGHFSSYAAYQAAETSWKKSRGSSAKTSAAKLAAEKAAAKKGHFKMAKGKRLRPKTAKGHSTSKVAPKNSARHIRGSEMNEIDILRMSLGIADEDGDGSTPLGQMKDALGGPLIQAGRTGRTRQVVTVFNAASGKRVGDVAAGSLVTCLGPVPDGNAAARTALQNMNVSSSSLARGYFFVGANVVDAHSGQPTNQILIDPATVTWDPVGSSSHHGPVTGQQHGYLHTDGSCWAGSVDAKGYFTASGPGSSGLCSRMTPGHVHHVTGSSGSYVLGTDAGEYEEDDGSYVSTTPAYAPSYTPSYTSSYTPSYSAPAPQFVQPDQLPPVCLPQTTTVAPVTPVTSVAQPVAPVCQPPVFAPTQPTDLPPAQASQPTSVTPAATHPGKSADGGGDGRGDGASSDQGDDSDQDQNQDSDQDQDVSTSPGTQDDSGDSSGDSSDGSGSGSDADVGFGDVESEGSEYGFELEGIGTVLFASVLSAAAGALGVSMFDTVRMLQALRRAGIEVCANGKCYVDDEHGSTVRVMHVPSTDSNPAAVEQAKRVIGEGNVEDFIRAGLTLHAAGDVRKDVALKALTMPETGASVPVNTKLVIFALGTIAVLSAAWFFAQDSAVATPDNSVGPKHVYRAPHAVRRLAWRTLGKDIMKKLDAADISAWSRADQGEIPRELEEVSRDDLVRLLGPTTSVAPATSGSVEASSPAVGSVPWDLDFVENDSLDGLPVLDLSPSYPVSELGATRPDKATGDQIVTALSRQAAPSQPTPPDASGKSSAAVRQALMAAMTQSQPQPHQKPAAGKVSVQDVLDKAARNGITFVRPSRVGPVGPDGGGGVTVSGGSFELAGFDLIPWTPSIGAYESLNDSGEVDEEEIEEEAEVGATKSRRRTTRKTPQRSVMTRVYPPPPKVPTGPSSRPLPAPAPAPSSSNASDGHVLPQPTPSPAPKTNAPPTPVPGPSNASDGHVLPQPTPQPEPKTNAPSSNTNVPPVNSTSNRTPTPLSNTGNRTPTPLSNTGNRMPTPLSNTGNRTPTPLHDGGSPPVYVNSTSSGGPGFGPGGSGPGPGGSWSDGSGPGSGPGGSGLTHPSVPGSDGQDGGSSSGGVCSCANCGSAYCDDGEGNCCQCGTPWPQGAAESCGQQGDGTPQETPEEPSPEEPSPEEPSPDQPDEQPETPEAPEEPVKKSAFEEVDITEIVILQVHPDGSQTLASVEKDGTLRQVGPATTQRPSSKPGHAYPVSADGTPAEIGDDGLGEIEDDIRLKPETIQALKEYVASGGGGEGGDDGAGGGDDGGGGSVDGIGFSYDGAERPVVGGNISTPAALGVIASFAMVTGALVWIHSKGAPSKTDSDATDVSTTTTSAQKKVSRQRSLPNMKVKQSTPKQSVPKQSSPMQSSPMQTPKLPSSQPVMPGAPAQDPGQSSGQSKSSVSREVDTLRASADAVRRGASAVLPGMPGGLPKLPPFSPLDSTLPGFPLSPVTPTLPPSPGKRLGTPVSISDVNTVTNAFSSFLSHALPEGMKTGPGFMMSGMDEDDYGLAGLPILGTSGAGTSGATYTVVKGDGMSSIAKKSGGTGRPHWFKELTDANPQKKLSTTPDFYPSDTSPAAPGWGSLQPGEVINIPDAWGSSSSSDQPPSSAAHGDKPSVKASTKMPTKTNAASGPSSASSNALGDKLMQLLKQMEPTLSGMSAEEALVPIVPGPGFVTPEEAIRRGARPFLVGESLAWNLSLITDRSGDSEIAAAEKSPGASLVVDLGDLGRPTVAGIMVGAATSLGLSLFELCGSVKKLVGHGIEIVVPFDDSRRGWSMAPASVVASSGDVAGAEASALVGDDFVRRVGEAGLGFRKLLSPPVLAGSGVGPWSVVAISGATAVALIGLYLAITSQMARSRSKRGARYGMGAAPRHTSAHSTAPAHDHAPAVSVIPAGMTRSFHFLTFDPASLQAFFASAGVDKVSELSARIAELQNANPGKTLSKLVAGDAVYIPATWPDRPQLYSLVTAPVHVASPAHASPAATGPATNVPSAADVLAKAVAFSKGGGDLSSAITAATKISPLLSSLSGKESDAQGPGYALPALSGDGTEAFFAALPALLIAGFMTVIALGWKYQDKILRAFVKEGAKDPDLIRAAIDQASRDPAVMDAVVQSTMKDPRAVGRLLDTASKNPKIVQAIVRAASENPRAVQSIIDATMADPKATQAILDAAAKNPKVMKAVVSHATQGGGLPAVLTQAASSLAPLLKAVVPGTAQAPSVRGAVDVAGLGSVDEFGFDRIAWRVS